MPGLTVSTSPSSSTTAPTTHKSNSSRSLSSRSASPVRPPYSPITPTLSAARLATSSSALSVSSQNGDSTSYMQTQSHPQPQQRFGSMDQQRESRQTYTHSQEPQISIAQPATEPLRFEENPDVLAMKSTISILQLQARNAENDMRRLQRIKERAVEDPEGFVGGLVQQEQREREEAAKEMGRDSEDEDDDDDDDDDDEEEDEDEEMGGVKTENEGERQVNRIAHSDVDMVVRKDSSWEKLPTPQNIARCPPINWAKYGVVGDTLDKMHEDQVRRPSEGLPARINADGSVTLVYGDGVKKEYALMKPMGLNEVVTKSKKKKS